MLATLAHGMERALLAWANVRQDVARGPCGSTVVELYSVLCILLFSSLLLERGGAVGGGVSLSRRLQRSVP